MSRNLDKNVFIAKKPRIKQGLPVNKMLLTAALSGLIFLAVAQISFIKLADANPSLYIDRIQVPALAYPSITILSPTENKTLNKNNLIISFKATIKLGSANTYRKWSENPQRIWSATSQSYPNIEPADFNLYIESARYNMSWQPNNITVVSYDYADDITEYSGNLSLAGAPEGNQTVTIMVYGGGSCSNELVLYYFYAVSYCTVGFTVDTTSPSVSISSLENRTYETSDIPLNFTVNESVTLVSYSLDGQANVTVAGNTTLAGLSVGEHNVTVYAWDAAGNVGASETIYFSIAEPEPQSEPFPTTMVIAPIASVTVIGVGLLVYLKKRKK